MSTPVSLVAEHERDPIRLRIQRCECTDGDCTTHYVCAQAGHDRLWMTTGYVAHPDEVEDQVEFLLADEWENGSCPSEVIEGALALYGLPWEMMNAAEVLQAQLIVFDRTPDWMQRLPLARVWATRGVVFGKPLTRVRFALEAVDRAYVDEGPALRAWEDA